MATVIHSKLFNIKLRINLRKARLKRGQYAQRRVRCRQCYFYQCNSQCHIFFIIFKRKVSLLRLDFVSNMISLKLIKLSQSCNFKRKFISSIRFPDFVLCRIT